MEITPTTQPNHPIPNMMNQFAKLLPILALIISVPTVANIAQAQPQQGYGGRMEHGMGRTEELNLTADQKTKLEQLRQSSRTQIEAILTPAQLPKFQQIENQRQAKGESRTALNLSSDQKTRIQSIRKANMEKVQAILTPEQQAQIKQGDGGRRGGMRKITLSADQKTKIEQLRADGRAQMDTILTPAQQQQVKVMQDRHQAMGNDWKGLNLTADQKTKMKAIYQASEVQFKAILTPAQLTKLEAGHRGKKPRG